MSIPCAEVEQAFRELILSLRCEWCGHRSWLDYFRRTVKSAEHSDG